MLDLKLLRSDPEAARVALERRGAADLLDRALTLDARRRELLPQIEGLRAEQNEANGAIAEAKRTGVDAGAAIARMRDVAGRAKALGEELAGVEADLQGVMSQLPNLPDAQAPAEDTVLKHVGDATRTGRDHLELAGAMIDMEAGARLSGSRFAYLKGDLVLLELALVRWTL